MVLLGVLWGESALETRVCGLTMIEDEVLKWRFRRGSREALARIYEKYVHLLLSIAMGLLNDPHEAEDVVQDVFVSFAQAGSRIQPVGDLRKYLVTCVANRIRNRRRDQGRRKTSGLSTAQVIYNNFLNGDWKRQSYYKPTREQIAQGALYGWVHDNNFNAVMSRSADAVNLAGCFAQCPIPTLIVEGTWDMSWNMDKPKTLAANHPNARLVMFEESGHNPFEDEPVRFFAVLKEFMGTLRETPALQLQYWKESLSARQESPAVFVGKLGWGRKSNQQLASKYDKAWLDQIQDGDVWLKIGLALYDVGRDEDALPAFEKMETLAGDNPRGKMMATLWQAHMLDLLGKRQAAIATYRIVAEMGIKDFEQRHDQFGLAYTPSPYARERMTKPFTRVENQDEN